MAPVNWPARGGADQAPRAGPSRRAPAPPSARRIARVV